MCLRFYMIKVITMRGYLPPFLLNWFTFPFLLFLYALSFHFSFICYAPYRMNISISLGIIPSPLLHLHSPKCWIFDIPLSVRRKVIHLCRLRSHSRLLGIFITLNSLAFHHFHLIHIPHSYQKGWRKRVRKEEEEVIIEEVEENEDEE